MLLNFLDYNYGSKKKKPAHLQACSRPILKSGTLKGGLKRGRKKKSFLLTHKKGKQRHVNTRPYIPVGERENYGDFQDDEGFIDGDDDYGELCMISLFKIAMNSPSHLDC